MTKKEFIDKLLYCVYNLKTTYYNKLPYNCGYNHGKYYSYDCWCWIKVILWGWVPGYNTGSYLHAPGQNGVGDWTGEEIMRWCENVSADFTSIPQADLLLTLARDHMGCYIGKHFWNGYEFNAVECTPQITNKTTGALIMSSGCHLSYVDEKGNRFNHKGGQKVGVWAQHGTIPILEDDGREFDIVYEDEDVILGKVKK